LVLKVGDQQIIGSPDAFNKGHPPNLVSGSFPSASSCWFSCALLNPNFFSIFQGLGHPQSHPHLPKRAAGVAKQAAQVEASLARKEEEGREGQEEAGEGD
jgi:hypothetical protein